MNYAAHAGLRLGIKAAMVTSLAKEDKYVIQNIQADGIDCYPVYSPYSTLMTLEYKTRDVDKRSLYVKHVADTIHPEHLDGLEARAIAVSPSIRGEVEPCFSTNAQAAWRYPGGRCAGVCACAARRRPGVRGWGEMDEVLQALDILKSDAVEAKFLTGETDIEKAAAFYASQGVKEIVLTHSSGVLIHADGQNHHFEFHSSSMDSRSGCGIPAWVRMSACA